MSKLQENNFLQSSKLAKFCEQNCMNVLASSENSQSLYSIAFTSRGKIQRFVAPDRSKMISLPDSDDVPVDLFLPPLVALLFLLLLVTYKILSSSKLFFLFSFFLKRSWRCNFPPNKRSRQRSWPWIFPPKNNPVSAHTLIYVSQCEMRHSNPVPQHGVFSAHFPVLSLFVRHSCFACLLPLSIALFDVERRFFVACFLDLFLSPLFCFTCL